MYNWVYQLNIYQSYKARYKHLKMSSGIYCARLVIIFYFLKPMRPIPADPTDAEAVQRSILGTLRFEHNCILRLVED